MTETPTTTVWAGFWRRVGGFLLDSLILGAAGFAASFFFRDQLSAIDGPTRMIGLAVSLAYHGILTSGPGGGRTLGMRMVGLKVTRLSGKPLGMVAAFWRALLLSAPFMLNGQFFPIQDERLASAISIPLLVLIFGFPIAQLVLLLFNGPSRRLVHDLFSGAIVVRSTAREIPPVRSIGAMTTAVVVLLTVTAAMVALVYGLAFGGLKGLIPAHARQAMGELTAVQAAVARLPGVMVVSVNDNVTTMGGSRTRTLIITARVAAWPATPQTLVDQIGQTATRTYKLAPDQTVRVVLTRGFDIGIASFWNSQSFDYVAPTPKPAASTPPQTATPT